MIIFLLPAGVFLSTSSTPRAPRCIDADGPAHVVVEGEGGAPQAHHGGFIPDIKSWSQHNPDDRLTLQNKCYCKGESRVKKSKHTRKGAARWALRGRPTPATPTATGSREGRSSTATWRRRFLIRADKDDVRLDKNPLVLRPGKRGRQSTGAAAPRTSPRKSCGRRISVHPPGEGAHEYARVGDSKTCTFCTKLKKCEAIQESDVNRATPGLRVCARCWDSKGFRRWHDFGNSPVATLNAEMKNLEPFQSPLVSDGVLCWVSNIPFGDLKAHDGSRMQACCSRQQPSRGPL